MANVVTFIFRMDNLDAGDGVILVIHSLSDCGIVTLRSLENFALKVAMGRREGLLTRVTKSMVKLLFFHFRVT